MGRAWPGDADITDFDARRQPSIQYGSPSTKNAAVPTVDRRHNVSADLLVNRGKVLAGVRVVEHRFLLAAR